MMMMMIIIIIIIIIIALSRAQSSWSIPVSALQPTSLFNERPGLHFPAACNFITAYGGLIRPFYEHVAYIC
jgi:hypothetical protein